MTPEEKDAFKRGQDAAPLFNCCGTVFVSLVYLPVLLGGLKLTQGTVGGLATAGVVMAMLPCSAAFLIGLPVGIWGLMVLNRPGLQDALREPRRRRCRRDDDDEWDD